MSSRSELIDSLGPLTHLVSSLRFELAVRTFPDPLKYLRQEKELKLRVLLRQKEEVYEKIVEFGRSIQEGQYYRETNKTE